MTWSPRSRSGSSARPSRSRAVPAALRSGREPRPRARAPTRRRGGRDLAAPLSLRAYDRDEADLTPVTEPTALSSPRWRMLADAATRRCDPRRGARRIGAGSRRWIVDRSTARGTTREDSRCGDAYRARGKRGRPCRCRLRAVASRPLVGGARGRCIRTGEPIHVSTVATAGRGAVVLTRGEVRRSHGAPGIRAASATSGRTCSSPKAPSTASRRRRRQRMGSRRGAGHRRRGRRELLRLRREVRGSTAEPGVTSNGLLHDELLAAVQGQTRRPDPSGACEHRRAAAV